MNSKILLLPYKRTRTAFRGNFVNRYMKPSVIVKKTDMLLNGPPFVAVPIFPSSVSALLCHAYLWHWSGMSMMLCWSRLPATLIPNDLADWSREQSVENANITRP